MAKLPVVSGREAMRAFRQTGYEVARQRGSHIIMTKPETPTTLSAPDHAELRAGTLRALIRKAGLTTDEFMELLRQ